MNMVTNLLGQELKTNSGAVGVVVLEVATPPKIEVALVEPNGTFITTLLGNCRLLK